MILRKWVAVAACMLALAGPACAQTQGESDKGNPQQQNTQPEQAKTIPPQTPISRPPIQPQATNERLAETKIYQPDCGKPKDQPDADLCTQRRVADAAENALQYALAQTIIGALGVAFVVVTLGFTALANKAAAIAAQAAVDAVGAERAWMTHSGFQPGTVGEATIDGVPVERGIFFQLHWRNSGRSPAVGVQLWTNFRCIPKGTALDRFDIEAADLEGQSSMAIGANGVVSGNPIVIHGNDLLRFESLEIDVIVWSRIEYGVTTSNVRYFSEFTAKVDWSGNILDENTGHSSPRVALNPIGPQNAIGSV